MKKVLFLTRLYHPHIGGVEKHVAKISQLLQAKPDQALPDNSPHNSAGWRIRGKQYSVSIVTEQYGKNLKTKKFIKSSNVQGKPFPEWKPQDVPGQSVIYRIPIWDTTEKQKKWRIWRWLWENRTLIDQTDIIHIHDVFFWWLPFRFLYPRKKVFITFHGYEGSKPPKVAAVIQRKLAELLTQGNICVGKFMYQWYGTRPGLVTYGAGSLNPSPLPKNLSAIFIGRLDYDTGIMAYLQAIKLLNHKISLTVFGTGPLLTRAQNYVKTHGLTVTFKGETLKATTELKHHRFAFVSRYLSIIESMQTKRLVFAHYNNPIKKDYLLCHPQANNMIIFSNPQKLVEKVSYILNHPKQERQFIDRAFFWAKLQTWDKLANQYKRLWRLE